MAPPASELRKSEEEDDRSLLIGKLLAHPEPDDEIVISGIAGSYPNSLNIHDFRDNIFNKVDLVSGDTRRWDVIHPEIPNRGGRIYEVEKFDASFFGIHYKQAHCLDPMVRIFLEKTFEAIVDAGLHINEVRGTKTGVYVGSCFSETEKAWIYEQFQPNGFPITGCIRSMLSNRVSYWLGVDGPSYNVDTACSSSLYALEHAYRAIRTGQCDMAIVGGCNVCLHPYVTLQFARLGVLNKDGKCKCFDETADGYTRAEAIVSLVLQKAKDARRVYCQLVHAKTNCDGFKEQGITYPSGQIQSVLLKEFYDECGVNPMDVSYVEAHGTGTKVGDPEELLAIDTIFCKEKRKTPLMVGSIKSNIGHSEAVSGLCSITKVILSMETGYLIPNINFNKARPEMVGLTEGRLQVITEKMKWNAGYAAVSNFGFGGANCHALLKSFDKEKINGGRPKDDIPRLVCISGRTEEAIHAIIDDMITRPIDAEYIGLLYEAFKYDIAGHIYRGYGILTKEKLVTRDLKYYPYIKKPLWFIFSGLDSFWPGMGTELMKIPVFAATIERCHQVLSSKQINIVDIITSKDKNICNNITNTLIGITAVQIALVDILKTIDINADKIVGYSIGEIACAYYDNCLTLEEAILTVYYIGKAIEHCKTGNGVMISIQSNIEKIKNLLIPGVEISCINSSENNCILSGSVIKINELIGKLKEKNISYSELDTNNIALHSSYVKEIGSSVLKYLKQCINNPKERSDKWLSTIITTEKQDKLCSAEFLSCILANKLNLENVILTMPYNAVALEISPHGFLQNILKRSDFDDNVNIAIMQKYSKSDDALMTAIGELYMEGLNPKINQLYPAVQFPVSRGTPMISPYIKWDHSQNWFVTRFEVQDKIKSGERIVAVKLSDDEDEQKYLSGHVIDGRILYPATGYLALVWETLGMIRSQVYTELSVVFENVKFQRATNIPKEGRIYLTVMLQKVSGNFEVMEGGSAIVTGRVYVPEDISKETLDFSLPTTEKKDFYVPLSSRDIYKELRLRGYNYSGLFRGLKSCDTTATVGEVYWKKNWVSFMDTVLQLVILQEDTRGLFVPTAIQRLSIDVKKHKTFTDNLEEDENGTIPAYVYKNIKTVTCGGVEIRGLNASAIARKKNLGQPVLEKYEFIPNALDDTLSLAQSIRVMLHIVLENLQITSVKTIEIVDEFSSEENPVLSKIVEDALDDLPLKQADANIIATKPMEIEGVTFSDKKLVSETNCMIIIATNIIERTQVLQTALNALVQGGFIIAREKLDVNLSNIDESKVNVICNHRIQNERILLLRKSLEKQYSNFVNISDPDYKFDWISVLQNTLKTEPNTVVYVQSDSLNGLIGFANCLISEPSTKQARFVFIMDNKASVFDPNDEFYASQLRKGLASNIYKNGEWGTYRHLLMEEMKSVEVEHAYVNVTVRGDLSSLRWIEGSLSFDAEFDCNEVLVYTYYSAMNFRDIMTATGRIAPEVITKGRVQQECVQGLEFSGRLSNGRRVIGMIPHMATATLIKADPKLMWEIPDEWSLEEAVTIPVVYGTVLFAFMIEGRIQPGMSVLIHAGSGGIGQAAINIALFHGCTVYTTVGTPEKREFIKKTWPQIKDNQIGNSRDTSFEQMIMSETNGRGVDMILNSLAEEKLQASVRCLAKGGKFLEIGKFDISNDNPLPLNMFLKEASFHGIMLDTFFYSANYFKQRVNILINEGINNGSIKPLPRNLFTENELEDMFRFMATGKHMGKVVLKIRDEEPEKVTEPSRRLIKALPRYYASGFNSYIIVGGLGGFGLELSDWLILRGVKKIVITSRKGITTGYQAYRIRIWKSYGVEIIISTADVTTYEGCKTLIEQAMEMGPVEAIFNLAVVLKDQLFENQTVEDFQISFAPKAVATKYLDELSRELCPDLKQFVVFSSVSCGRGNMGQTNYGMSNSVMERICEKRKEDGFPALAVEWGAVGDVGLVAEMQEEHTEMVIGGTLQQRISNCLLILDQFLRQSNTIVASMLVAEKRGAMGVANIVDAVVNILGIRDIRTVSTHSTLAELGMDSIMAVEIKQTLEREFEVFLTPQDIRSMTFARLHEIAAEKENKDDSGNIINEALEKAEVGLNMLIRVIGDEVTSFEPYFIYPNRASEDNKNCTVLIPGIEGMATILETVATNLTSKAVVLQISKEENIETMQDIAKSLYQHTVSNLDSTDNTFNIVGYSYGAVIALEIAAMLEADGRIGRIILIDGSPKMMKTMVSQHLQIDDENQIQNTVIALVIGLVIDGDTINMVKEIYESCSSWEEKVEKVVENGPKQYSLDYYRKIINAVYQRLHALLYYECTVPKLKSTIKLLKPKHQTIIHEEEDLGLSEFSEHPIEIEYLEGNHVLIVENIECANEINKTFGFAVNDVITELKDTIISDTLQQKTTVTI